MKQKSIHKSDTSKSEEIDNSKKGSGAEVSAGAFTESPSPLTNADQASSNSTQAQDNKKDSESSPKTPMCLINELVRFNKVSQLNIG